MDEVHPLLAARPPTTDAITYLAIIEVNLKKEDLPLLLNILQDEALTREIGWDLVLTLLPMLPESEPCLKLIARLGNPREVMLKTTEALRLIVYDPIDEVDEEEEEEEEEETEVDGHITCAHEHSHRTVAIEEAELSRPLPQAVLQFQILVDMLRVLHPRIKTKFPSRFLSTTLQGVLASFSDAESHLEVMALSIVALVKTLIGLLATDRPALPPRASRTNVTATYVSAADPEAVQSGSLISEEDKAIQARLLLAFVTHVFEVYTLSLSCDDDVVAMAWSAQIFEKTFPQKAVPGRKTIAEKLAPGGTFETRLEIASTCLALARDLGANLDSLLEAASQIPQLEEVDPNEEDDPPTKPEDIPLSQTGSLFLAAQSMVSIFLRQESPRPMSIFPQQFILAQQFIGREESGGMSMAGSEPQAIIDSIVAVGLLALDTNDIGEPETDEVFTQYLARVALISANTPSASLRFNAHTLVTTVLRSHPSDFLRLTFIRDTLEHCPYENLKASAVSWIKGETLEANGPGQAQEEAVESIFATPAALQTLAPFLFPDLTRMYASTQSILESWALFCGTLSFYLAALNFDYLLLVAQRLHCPLDILTLHRSRDVGSLMLQPLREAGLAFRDSLRDGDLADEEGPTGVRVAMMDLDILDDVLDRVEHGLIWLGVAT